MHIRVKFGKYGTMKYIGHLDTMRYFQKSIRRAGIDVRYSEGYSPHMIMSFASPLGVGITSSGEYFDMEVNSSFSSQESIQRLNACMADGMEVKSYRKISDKKKSNAMALVAAADYQVTFRQGYEPENGWQNQLAEYIGQPAITLWKKTKKSEKEIDIRPYIYDFHIDEEKIFFQLSAGSVTNIKPELVMDGFYKFRNQELPAFALEIHRQEMYARRETLISLEDLGEELE